MSNKKEQEYILTEEDFYPPSDDRVWTSNVEDIDDGDNFADYCEEFFEMLDEEEYYDNWCILINNVIKI